MVQPSTDFHVKHTEKICDSRGLIKAYNFAHTISKIHTKNMNSYIRTLSEHFPSCLYIETDSWTTLFILPFLFQILFHNNHTLAFQGEDTMTDNNEMSKIMKSSCYVVS